jgi:hypothetical protein
VFSYFVAFILSYETASDFGYWLGKLQCITECESKFLQDYCSQPKKSLFIHATSYEYNCGDIGISVCAGSVVTREWSPPPLKIDFF